MLLIHCQSNRNLSKTVITNSVCPDQMVSEEALLSVPTLFENKVHFGPEPACIVWVIINA